MFKLESYLAPWLLSYINQYVELKREDFQLSLWGGDAVFNNLKLRLSAIQKLVPQLPIEFTSGKITELRIHVPWTRITSEPIIVTINQIELVVVLNKDCQFLTSYSRSSSNNSLNESITSDSVSSPSDTSYVDQSNYMQTILTRVINNVHLIVNNLIVKFIEDDIVLSLSIKTCECYSVNQQWDKSYIDLTVQDLFLRRILSLSDVVLCLDKTDQSGKIKLYQDPIIYRCSIQCRIQMGYTNILQKKPFQIRLSFHCVENFILSINDLQLPMCMKLIEICLAIFYGQLYLPNMTTVTKETAETKHNTLTSSTTTTTTISPLPVPSPPPTDSTQTMSNEQSQAGWVQWAWSYVPSISTVLGDDSETTENHDQEQQQLVQQTPQALILFAGLYFDHIILQFKLTHNRKHYTSEKMVFIPFMEFTADKASVEIVKRQNECLVVQFGIRSMAINALGQCSCGFNDGNNNTSVITPLFFSNDNESYNDGSYLSWSLFCPDDRLQPLSSFVFDLEQRCQELTDKHVLERYGAFYFEYYWCIDMSLKKNDDNDGYLPHEDGRLRFLFDSYTFNISATSVHHLMKILQVAQIETYTRTYWKLPTEKELDLLDTEHIQVPDEKIVRKLDSYFPLRYYITKINNLNIYIYPYKHQSTTKQLTPSSYYLPQSSPSSIPQTMQSLFLVTINNIDFNISTPMYSRKIVRLISLISTPSKKILCNSQTQFLFHVPTIILSSDMQEQLVTLNELKFHFSLLPHAHLWKKQHQIVWEFNCECSKFNINLTKQFSLQIYQIFVQQWFLTIDKELKLKLPINTDVPGVLPMTSKGHSNENDGIEISFNQFHVHYFVTFSSFGGTLNLYSFHIRHNQNQIFEAPINTKKFIENLYQKHSLHAQSTSARKNSVSDGNNVRLVTPGSASPYHNQVQQVNIFLSSKFQCPISFDFTRAPSFLCFDLQGFYFHLNPIINDYFNYLSSHIEHQQSVLPRTTTILEDDHMSISSSTTQSEIPSRFFKRPSPEPIQKPKTPNDVYALIRTTHLHITIHPNLLVLSKHLVLCLPDIELKSSQLKMSLWTIEHPTASVQNSTLTGDRLPWLIKFDLLQLFLLKDTYSLQLALKEQKTLEENITWLIRPFLINIDIPIKCEYKQTVQSLNISVHIHIPDTIQCYLSPKHLKDLVQFIQTLLQNIEQIQKFISLVTIKDDIVEQQQKDNNNDLIPQSDILSIKSMIEHSTNSLLGIPLDDEIQSQSSSSFHYPLFDPTISPYPSRSSSTRITPERSLIVQQSNKIHYSFFTQLTLSKFLLICDYDVNKHLSTQCENLLLFYDADEHHHKLSFQIQTFSIKKEDETNICETLTDGDDIKKAIHFTMTRATVDNLYSKLNLPQIRSNKIAAQHITELLLTIKAIELRLFEFIQPIIAYKAVIKSRPPMKKNLKEMPLFFPWDIPLISMDIQKIRVLLPIHQIQTTNSYEKFNMFLLQIDRTKIEWQLDNPIQRNSIKYTQIYEEARTKGETVRPGTYMEDRQYRLSMSNITFQLCSISSKMTNTDTFEQQYSTNPAHVWNTTIMNNNDDEILQKSLMEPFSFTVAIALPLFSKYNSQLLLLNGYVMEVHCKTVCFHVTDQDLSLMTSTAANMKQIIESFIQQQQPFASEISQPLFHNKPSEPSKSTSVIPFELFMVADRLTFDFCTISSSLLNPVCLIEIESPHTVCTLFSEHKSHHIQLCIYDLRIRQHSNDSRGNQTSSFIPHHSLFSSPVFETRQGEVVNRKTGLISNFLTFYFDYDFIHEEKYNLLIERQSELHINPILLLTFCTLVKNLDTIVKRYKPITVSDQKSTNQHCSRIIKLDLSTFPIALFWDKHTELSLGNIRLTIDYDSNSAAVCYGLVIKDLRLNFQSKRFLNPCTITSTIDHFQSSTSSIKFDVTTLAIQFTFDTLHFILEQTQIIKNLVEQLKLVFVVDGDHVKVAKQIKNEILFVDDLRNGSMKYVFDEGNGDEPQVNEIVFSHSQDNKTSCMTWKYENRRTIIKCSILPLPFEDELGGITLVDENNVTHSKQPQRVECLLQYWHPCYTEFLTYHNFKLVDGESTFMDFSSDLNLNPFSDIWRIVILHHTSILTTSQISANSLAASTRIDSFQSNRYQPQIQMILTIPNIRLNFLLNDETTTTTNDLIQFYSTLKKCSHDVLTLNLDNLSFDYCQRFESKLFDFETSLSIDYLEYRFLTRRSCLEPAYINLKLFINDKSSSSSLQTIFDTTTQNSKYSQLFNDSSSSTIVTIHQIKMYIDHLNIRFSQSLFHLFNILYMTWMKSKLFDSLTQDTKKLFSATIPSESQENVLSYYTYYLFYNHLNYTVELKQYGTNEQILIEPHTSIDYSWYKHSRTPLLLSFSIPQLNHIQTGAYNIHHIDEIDQDNENLTISSLKLLKFINSPYTMYIKNDLDQHGIRRSIHLFGSLIIRNFCDIDLTLHIEQQKTTSILEKILPANGQYVSLIQSVQQMQAIKWKIVNNDKYSERYLIQDLLQQPQQGIFSSNGNNTSLWIHLFNEIIFGTDSMCTCLVFTPIVIYRSYLTDSIYLHLNQKSKQSTSYPIETTLLLESNAKTNYYYSIHKDFVYTLRLQQLDSKTPTDCVYELNSLTYSKIENIEYIQINTNQTITDYVLELKSFHQHHSHTTSIVDLLQEQQREEKKTNDIVHLPSSANDVLVPITMVQTISANGPSMYDVTSNILLKQKQSEESTAVNNHNTDAGELTNSIDCRLETSLLYSKLNTILIKLKPSTIIQNLTPYEFIINFNQNEQKVYLLREQSLCLPKLTSNLLQFTLLINDTDRMQCSPIEIISSSVIASSKSNRLYLNSSLDLNFIASSNTEHYLFKIKFIHLDNTNIFTLSSKYVLNNKTNMPLKCRILLWSPLKSSLKPQQQPQTVDTTINVLNVDKHSLCSIYRFQDIPNTANQYYLIFEHEMKHYSQYVSKPIRLVQKQEQDGDRQCLCLFKNDTFLNTTKDSQNEQKKSTRKYPQNDGTTALKKSLSTDDAQLKSTPLTSGMYSLSGELIAVTQLIHPISNIIHLNVNDNSMCSYLQIVNACICPLLCRTGTTVFLPHLLPPLSSTLIGLDARNYIFDIDSSSSSLTMSTKLSFAFFPLNNSVQTSSMTNFRTNLLTLYFQSLSTVHWSRPIRMDEQAEDVFLPIPGLHDVLIRYPSVSLCSSRTIIIEPVHRQRAVKTTSKTAGSIRRSLKHFVSSRPPSPTQIMTISETTSTSRHYRSASASASSITVESGSQSDDDVITRPTSSDLSLSSLYAKLWSPPPSSTQQQQQQKQQVNTDQKHVYLTFQLNKLSLLLLDELTNIQIYNEIVRITIDQIDLHFYQRLKCQDSLNQQQLLLTFEQLQIDNQLYSPKQAYDFPVVLMSKDKLTKTTHTKKKQIITPDNRLPNDDMNESSSSLLPITAVANSPSRSDSSLTRHYSSSSTATSDTVFPRRTNNHSIMVLTSDTCPSRMRRERTIDLKRSRSFFYFNLHRFNSRLIKIDLNLKSFDLCIEDHFIYALLDVFSHLLPLNLRLAEHEEQRKIIVEYIDDRLSHPFICETLIIDVVDVTLSIHAQMKMYIGCNQLPMFIDKFHRQYLYVTRKQILSLLTRHYLLSLLTRTPWLLGSFDLLGNPSVLIRNITNGVYDMIHMPYIGMRHGPSGFMSGVSDGATSLLKHLSLGTLTSVTSFANSIARNMDRLAMDNEHSTRNEETRRQLPIGMTEGMLQGLELLSLSLLGAVAGLAEQPMQSFRNRHRGQTTTTVLSGVGKGLVGIVAKPVGGVAQLISQTGQGILYGSGLVYIPHRRYRQIELRTTNSSTSRLKFRNNIQSTDEILDALDYIQEENLNEQGSMLLTSNALILYSKDDENEKVKYSLADIDLIKPADSTTILSIVPASSKTIHTAINHDLIEAFVRSQQQPGIHTERQEQHQDRLSFYVDSRLRNDFISLFHCTKNQL